MKNKELKKLKKLGEQPKVVEADGQKVEQHSLTEQIELDRYVCNKRAAASGFSAIRCSKMKAGGA